MKLLILLRLYILSKRSEHPAHRKIYYNALQEILKEKESFEWKVKQFKLNTGFGCDPPQHTAF